MKISGFVGAFTQPNDWWVFFYYNILEFFYNIDSIWIWKLQQDFIVRY